ncbi:966_t:CDS:2, partial [Dentiscutata erythropus]
VQPLDVSINKPFKDRLREKWNMRMNVGEYKFTKKGNMKKPEYDIMYNSENHLIELDQIEEEEDCVIDLVDENKKNKENIATSSVPYINAERSYLIEENETEMISVLLC